MPEKIKMEYPLMQKMAQTFNEGSQQLQQINQAMKQIAEMLDSEALKGDGGAAFSDAIRGPLSGAIGRLDNKFKELRSDILGAMQDMMGADSDSKGMFG